MAAFLTVHILISDSYANPRKIKCYTPGISADPENKALVTFFVLKKSAYKGIQSTLNKLVSKSKLAASSTGENEAVENVYVGPHSFHRGTKKLSANKAYPYEASTRTKKRRNAKRDDECGSPTSSSNVTYLEPVDDMHTTALDIPFLQFRDTTAPEQCTVQAPTGDFLEQKDAGYYFDEQVSESTSYLALSPVNDPESGPDLIFLKGQMDTKSLNNNYPYVTCEGRDTS
jgi:hypothetical protein